MKYIRSEEVIFTVFGQSKGKVGNVTSSGMNLRFVGYEGSRWVELDQNRIHL